MSVSGSIYVYESGSLSGSGCVNIFVSMSLPGYVHGSGLDCSVLILFGLVWLCLVCSYQVWSALFFSGLVRFVLVSCGPMCTILVMSGLVKCDLGVSCRIRVKVMVYVCV